MSEEGIGKFGDPDSIFRIERRLLVAFLIDFLFCKVKMSR